MSKNLELMKKIIEEKKKKSSQQMSKGRPAKCIGGSRKGINSYKQGGVFDK
ncbi:MULTISPECIES: hypothetical protein [Clostridium]|uniref:hypothetical protein n=1 Tax=Clostridium TaxID=1485 RepID=UPI000312C44A|nr:MULTISPECIES: hypothetical protein [Clostridium]